ncbi:hypothetical protein ACFXKY_07735 [Streptomyces canus]|uniref:hypothetical protein n=1 Tax=Streptomyces canus TaxID=58343 RepID=UPI00369115E9
MNESFAYGALCILAVLALGTGLARWSVAPVRESGRHRAPRVQVVLPDASLDELLGDWPEPVPGALVAQGWRWCPNCVRTEPAVLHSDDCWRCGHCLEVTVGGVR